MVSFVGYTVFPKSGSGDQATGSPQLPNDACRHRPVFQLPPSILSSSIFTKTCRPDVGSPSVTGVQLIVLNAADWASLVTRDNFDIRKHIHASPDRNGQSRALIACVVSRRPMQLRQLRPRHRLAPAIKRAVVPPRPRPSGRPRHRRDSVVVQFDIARSPALAGRRSNPVGSPLLRCRRGSLITFGAWRKSLTC